MIFRSRVEILEVIAEGVSIQAQKEFLDSCGCRQAQGFLFGAAMVAEQALGFWRRSCGGDGRARA